MSALFQRRTVMREREELLIAYGDSSGEPWVDLQDYLDRVLVIVDDLWAHHLTLAEYKHRFQNFPPFASGEGKAALGKSL